MLVATYNPSNQMVQYLRIAVPHPNWKVEAFSREIGGFYVAPSNTICEDEVLTNDQVIKNCVLYVEYQILPLSAGVLKIEYSADKPEIKKQVQEQDPAAPIVVASKFETLTFNGFDNVVGLSFKVAKKNYQQEYDLGVDLRYWPSFQQSGQKSGAYIFRVKQGVTESLRYSALKGDPVVFKGDFMSQITFDFANDKGEAATLRMRMFDLSEVVEWDLDLKGIPKSDQGQEVIIQFKSNIKNEKTFYTDANGLEMQKRILDFRPTWDFHSVEVATKNYYPVNSAIAIKDTLGNHMTVLTPRSLGGSVLAEGQIELMHNRRMYMDDGRGVGEPLNEMDEFGNGMQVRTTYVTQMFNNKFEASLQRLQQQYIDDPIQYFFNFDYTYTPTPAKSTLIDLKDAGLPSTAKLVILPMGENSLIVRLTNLADKFDLTVQSEKDTPIPYIHIDLLAQKLYQLANKGVAPLQVSISETSLTGNQLFNQMKQGKTQWKGADDDTIVEPDLPKDRSLYEISLEAQRMRTFMVQYVPAAPQEAIFLQK